MDISEKRRQIGNKIRELRYPPYMRKLVGRIAWVLWAALALCALGVVLAGITWVR